MNKSLLLKVSLVLFIISISVVVMVLAKDLLAPLVISVFITYLLYPLVWKLERRGVHRVLAILIVLVTVYSILGAASFYLGLRVSHISVDLIELKQNIQHNADSVQQVLETKLGMRNHALDGYFDNIVTNIFANGESELGSLFETTSTTIFQLIIIPVFTFFFLYYRTKTARFIFMISGRNNKPKTLRILRQISNVTTQYVGGLLVVVLILAVLNSAGLYLLGVPYAFVFGVLAAVLNLIPYFGTLAGSFIPVIYVLLTVPNPVFLAIQILMLFTVIQLIENNLLTPNIVGSNIRINPFAIILSLLLANLVWGVAGMLVVVPCLAMAKIIMRNIDALKPFAFLISDKGMSKYRIYLPLLFRKKK